MPIGFLITGQYGLRDRNIQRILHLTNTEIKILHLMGMQYLGKPGQFTGDFGAYAIKKQRVTMESVEKLVRKNYKPDEKLIKFVFRLNKKFGIYHTVDMLNDSETLFRKCVDKREKNLVADFFALWEGKGDGI